MTDVQNSLKEMRDYMMINGIPQSKRQKLLRSLMVKP